MHYQNAEQMKSNKIDNAELNYCCHMNKHSHIHKLK